jgi:lipoprotein-anchoring transpeptidase ErfK/SrfK
MESPGKPAEKEGDKPENPYRVDDVPWVQYFVGGYALHAAYWHDDFGQPRSHGCINLSPRDARTLFNRTAPAIPVGWHGVVSGRGGAAQGTWVRVRW